METEQRAIDPLYAAAWHTAKILNSKTPEEQAEYILNLYKELQEVKKDHEHLRLSFIQAETDRAKLNLELFKMREKYQKLMDYTSDRENEFIKERDRLIGIITMKDAGIALLQHEVKELKETKNKMKYQLQRIALADEEMANHPNAAKVYRAICRTLLEDHFNLQPK